MDHTAMNHSMGGMDHAAMNHSMVSTTMNHTGHHGHSSATTISNVGGHAGHGSGDGTTMVHQMMQMYFTTQWQHSTVLFEGWVLHHVWQLVISCIFLGVLAALYEGLKVIREHLLVTYNEKQKSNSYAPNGGIKSESNSDEAFTDQPPRNVGSRMLSRMHFLQTFLHMLQVTVSYFLMLVFMTYNVWLCLSVILGAGLGYFLFGWKRAVINDSNEHCH